MFEEPLLYLTFSPKIHIFRPQKQANMHHLAQLNLALMKAPMDSPLLADFVAQIDAVNALAEASEGFVWRLKGDNGDATEFRFEGKPDLLINMSVWKSVEALEAFTYRNTAHLAVMRDRKKWFDHMERMHMVLWWIPAGHQPSLEEAKMRLEHLWEHGPTKQAFTFRTRFECPDVASQ